MTDSDNDTYLAGLQIGSRIGEIVAELEETRPFDDEPPSATDEALRATLVALIEGKEPIDASIACVEAWDTALAAQAEERRKRDEREKAEETKLADPDSRAAAVLEFARALCGIRGNLPGRLSVEDITITADYFEIRITLNGERWRFDYERDEIDQVPSDQRAGYCHLTDDLENPCTNKATHGDLCSEHVAYVLEEVAHSMVGSPARGEATKA